MKEVRTRIVDSVKSGFFKGVGLGAGLLTTGLFAAAAAMNVFAPGQTISSAQINQNFAIAAPEGAIMAFNLANCPDGWAPADGTNGTADLRGNFIRGLDSFGTPAGAAGRDPSGVRALAAYQDDRFQGHRHGRGQTEAVMVHDGGSFFPSGSAMSGYTLADFSIVLDPVADATNGAPRVANETRPENIALLFCQRKN